MKICIPVNEDKGMKSTVCGHFGSAPMFMIVDIDSGECQAIGNNNLHHAPGKCRPMAALAGTSVDGVVVGGIGTGALNKFQRGGIQVFLTQLETVEETVQAYKAGSLNPVTPATACAHHGHGPHGPGGNHGCGHG